MAGRTLPIVVSALVAGCANDSRSLSWTLQFSDDALRDRARTVSARILSGGCDSDRVSYDAEIGPGQGLAPRPEDLAPGLFGFSGRARDADCLWFASGCGERTLPIGDGETIAVVLEADPTPEAACVTCLDGACAEVDAGSGVDGGSSCEGRRADCNGNATDGCEADLDTSPDHCGECDRACRIDHGLMTCTSGACDDETLSECDPGWGDCNESASDGCERTLTTLADCGGCDLPCALDSASESCATGACQVTDCDGGFGDCNGIPSDGCESQLGSFDDCAACGDDCNLQDAVGDCVGGACVVVSCEPEAGDCDDVAANGCETDTRQDDAHCGGCDAPCGASERCRDSACQPD